MVKHGIAGACIPKSLNFVKWDYGLIPHECQHTQTERNTQYLIDSVSICTGAILSNKNLTISRNGLLGCLGLPSFLVMSL